MNLEESSQKTSITPREDLLKSPKTLNEEETSKKSLPKNLPKISMQETLSKLKGFSKNKVMPEISSALSDGEGSSPLSKKNSLSNLSNLKKKLIKMSTVLSAFTSLRKPDEPSHENLTINQLRLINDWTWFSKPAAANPTEVKQ